MLTLITFAALGSVSHWNRNSSNEKYVPLRVIVIGIFVTPDSLAVGVWIASCVRSTPAFTAAFSSSRMNPCGSAVGGSCCST